VNGKAQSHLGDPKSAREGNIDDNTTAMHMTAPTLPTRALALWL